MENNRKDHLTSFTFSMPFALLTARKILHQPLRAPFNANEVDLWSGERRRNNINIQKPLRAPFSMPAPLGPVESQLQKFTHNRRPPIDLSHTTLSLFLCPSPPPLHFYQNIVPCYLYPHWELKKINNCLLFTGNLFLFRTELSATLEVT